MATTGVCATQHQLTGLVLHSLYEDIEQQHRRKCIVSALLLLNCATLQ